MNCEAYRANYERFAKLPLPREVWDTPEWSAWINHFQQCRECSDWTLAQRVTLRGHNPQTFPCVHIANQLTQTCPQHPDPNDCPDIILVYEPRFDEYAISGRGREPPLSTIRFCPWCGIKLPE